ncbi:hypothetical protein JCM11641_002832 [Rhodosporidiobolus odoratus]
MTATARLARQAYKTPYARYSSYSSSSHSPYSPIPSTSRSTLDDPLPTWNDLLPDSPPVSALAQRHDEQRRHGQKSASKEGKRRPASLPTLAPAQAPPTVQSSRFKSPRRPPSEPTQISPYLPLFTRERSYLLTSLQQALYSCSLPSPPSSRQGRRTARRKGPAWNADQAWIALARVLRYPEEVPDLPHSYFPSSTRSPALLSYEDGDFSVSPSSSSSSSAEDDGFFTAARPSSSASSSSSSSLFPIPSSASAPPDSTGRTPLPLSTSQLYRAFTLFSTSRPRTKNGLNRLLVIAELLARKRGAAFPSVLQTYSGAGEGAAEDGGDEMVQQQLRGGGAGLRDKDWARLMLFAGANLRSTQQGDVRGALALYEQYLAQQRTRIDRRRRRRKRLDGRQSQDELGTSARVRDQQRVLLNVLLRLCRRAKMWDMFEQVRGRMRELGIKPDVATAMEEVLKDEQRGAGVEALWRGFEVALLEVEGDVERKQTVWQAMVWVFAKRGMMAEADRFYESMKMQREVLLDELRPEMEGAVLYSSGISVQPPPLSDRTYTALIQSFAFRGDFHSAIRILRDVFTSSSPASSSSGLSVAPAPHHFLPLFRAFATFGSTRASQSSSLNSTLLGGAHVRSHAVSRSLSPFAALTQQDSRYLRSSSQDNDDPFSLSALYSVFGSFLALTPPPPSTLSTRSFSGARTAPSPKDMWWILLAFEKLTDGESDAVLEVWDKLEEKFTGKEKEGWMGWREDKRIKRVVVKHRARVEELRLRWEELQ